MSNEMSKRTGYCYELGKDISLDDKAAVHSVSCEGCRYLLFCSREVAEITKPAVKTRKKRVKKDELVSGNDTVIVSEVSQITFDDLLDGSLDIGKDYVVSEEIDKSNESNEFLSDVVEIDLSLSDYGSDIGGLLLGDSFSTPELDRFDSVDSFNGTVDEVHVVTYDKLVDDDDIWFDGKSKIDSVSYYGIDLSDEPPYFSEEELVRLGRFASSSWR